IMKLVNDRRTTDDTAADILGVQVFDYTQGSVIVHLLFYVRRASTINMAHIQIFLNANIPLNDDGNQTLSDQYVIRTVSVFDHNDCTFQHDILPKADCGGFGECVNVVGRYRCHCTGDVNTQSGACVPPTTFDNLLQAVPEAADDDKWWIVYAVVFGALFVIIFLLVIALCCIECSGGSNKERYLVHSQYELSSGQHGYHHDIRIDDEVAPGNPTSYKMQNEYSMGDEVIAYKSPRDTKSGFYEINPIYDDNKGGTIRTEKSYSSVTTKGSMKSETESAYHSTTNGDDSPSTSPPPDTSL
ncbi:---NA---, partial [Paramuricea clavata]